MKFRQAGQVREFDVEVGAVEGGLRALIDGEEMTAVIEAAAGGTIIRVGTRALRTYSARRRDSILVSVGPAQFEFIAADRRSSKRPRGLATPEVTAPMPGKVVKVLVAEGQRVEAGDPLVVLEAMKMETALNAESAAMVKRICTAVGQMVDHGAILLELSPLESPAGRAAAARDS